MKHARDDYNRIQDPEGIIPFEEPVFLLRGQDKFAPKTLDRYRRLLISEGRKKIKIGKTKGIIPETKGIYEDQAKKMFDMAKMVEDHIVAMEHWQKEVRKKTPDV